jgi:sortase A
MKVTISQDSLRLMLRWIQRVLFVWALSALAYCGFVLTDGWLFQKREGHRLDQLLHERQNASAASRAVLATAATEGLIGRIVIERLGISVIVAEGVDLPTLRRAAGHIPGTPLPGQGGNVGISAHRDTFFRPLRNVRSDDLITVTTPAGEYRYRVVSTKIVSPEEVAVLDAGVNETLTLVTCYPFYFIGAAPNRFVVRAERIT